MIHFRQPPEKVQIANRPLTQAKYPNINAKVCKETAFNTKYSEEFVREVMKHWNDFLDAGMKNDLKVKLPYVGSFQPRKKYREVAKEEEKLNDSEFTEIEL